MIKNKFLTVRVDDDERQSFKDAAEKQSRGVGNYIKWLHNNHTDQATHRQEIEVGAGSEQVSPVMYWIEQGLLDGEAARGAFFLAYQQSLDGMGKSKCEWLGISEEQMSDYIRFDKIPGCP